MSNSTTDHKMSADNPPQESQNLTGVKVADKLAPMTLPDDIELRTDNGQPYLGITDIAEDNIVGLIAAQNLALLTRLEAAFDVEYQMICRENGVTRPTPHTAFHSIIQSERALIEKRMM